MHCLFRSNVADVRMMAFVSYMTNIMGILGHKILYIKLKINFMSSRTANVEYIMIQKDHKCLYQKCDFHLLNPPPLALMKIYYSIL